MKFAIQGAVFGAAALFAVAGTTAVQAVDVEVGPGGVHVGDHYRGHDRCRTIISHRTNRFGEEVTVRRRVCD